MVSLAVMVFVDVALVQSFSTVADHYKWVFIRLFFVNLIFLFNESNNNNNNNNYVKEWALSITSLWKIATGHKLKPSRLKTLKNLFKTFWKLKKKITLKATTFRRLLNVIFKSKWMRKSYLNINVQNKSLENKIKRY